MARERSRRGPLGRWRGSGQGTPPWVFVGLAVFVLLDAALVWWAIATVTSTTGAAGPVPTVVASVPVRTAPPTASAPATPEPAEPDAAGGDDQADLVVAPPSGLLAARDGEVAYRAPAGGCPGTPAAVEVTSDGGATWAPAAIRGASAVTRLEPGSRAIVDVLASDGGCAPTRFRSWVSGAEWMDLGAVGLGWRVGSAEAIAPTGQPSAPCPGVLQVAPWSDLAAHVLCADGRVAATSDGGNAWAVSEPISGLAGVAVGPTGAIVLIERQDGCPGVQVAALDAALVPGPSGNCLPTDAPDGASVVAVSADGGTLWLWTGGVVARSSDGGRTW